MNIVKCWTLPCFIELFVLFFKNSMFISKIIKCPYHLCLISVMNQQWSDAGRLKSHRSHYTCETWWKSAWFVFPLKIKKGLWKKMKKLTMYTQQKATLLLWTLERPTEENWYSPLSCKYIGLKLHNKNNIAYTRGAQSYSWRSTVLQSSAPTLIKHTCL